MKRDWQAKAPAPQRSSGTERDRCRFRGAGGVRTSCPSVSDISCRRPEQERFNIDLIPDRNLLHVVDNHNVAQTFLRIQLQTELILDGALKGRAGISLRHEIG